MDEQEIELRDEDRTTVEVWSRVMGYHRPTMSWNIGKKGEWKARKFFEESKVNDLKTNGVSTES